MSVTKIPCFIVFIYRCINNEVEILLLSKDGIKFEPFYFKNKNHDQVKADLLQINNLKQENFYKERFVDSCVMLTVGKKNIVYKIEASYARIKNNLEVLCPYGYKNIKWIKKKEALNYLNHWKGYTHSFKLVFSELETYWECVETE